MGEENSESKPQKCGFIYLDARHTQTNGSINILTPAALKQIFQVGRWLAGQRCTSCKVCTEKVSCSRGLLEIWCSSRWVIYAIRVIEHCIIEFSGCVLSRGTLIPAFAFEVQGNFMSLHILGFSWMCNV